MIHSAAISPLKKADEACYPFEKGKVCLDSELTTTNTPIPTIISKPIKISWQANFDFYRNPQIPIIGTTDGSLWTFPGNALSASVIPLWPNYIGGTKIKYARWVLVWNPNTDVVSTKVRLIKADSGITNVEEIAQISRSNYHNPTVNGVDITIALQSILDSGLSWKQLGQQTIGNGKNGCLIYASWIEIIWETK